MGFKVLMRVCQRRGESHCPIFILAIFILDSADARFRFQDSGFRGWSGLLPQGESHCPVFVFAIFILGSADARFRIQVSRFRFQASYYPTFFPAWKAVLSAAMVAWDAVSGQPRWQPVIGSLDCIAWFHKSLPMIQKRQTPYGACLCRLLIFYPRCSLTNC